MLLLTKILIGCYLCIVEWSRGNVARILKNNWISFPFSRPVDQFPSSHAEFPFANEIGNTKIPDVENTFALVLEMKVDEIFIVSERSVVIAHKCCILLNLFYENVQNVRLSIEYRLIKDWEWKYTNFCPGKCKCHSQRSGSKTLVKERCNFDCKLNFKSMDC